MHPTISQNLIKILSRLSKKEMKEVEIFINTSLHNTNTSVCTLFQVLKPFYPKFKIESKDLENIYQSLYPNATNWMKDPKIASRYRSLSSKLSGYLKDFLAFKEYQQDKVAQKKYLLTALGKKDLSQIFNQTLEKTELQWTTAEHKNEETYLHLALLKQQQFYHPIFLNEAKFKSLLPVIEQSAHYLLLYNALYELKLRAEQLNSGKIYSKESSIRSIEEILLPIKGFSEIQDILFQLYIDLNQLLEEESNLHLFHRLFQKFCTHFEQIDIIEQRSIIHKLTNYCIRRSKLDTTFRQNALDLYKFSLKHKLLFFNKHINYLVFNNIVVVSCMLGRFKWAHHFITTYHHQIGPTKIKEDITRLSWAFWNLYQHNYEAVIEKLQKPFNISNIVLNLLARSMHLRALYEVWQKNNTFMDLEETYEKVRKNSYSFSKYILRKKTLTTNVQERYTNLVYFIQKLIILKLQKYQTGIHPDTTPIFKELKEKSVVEKKWVEKKLHTL